MRATPPGPISMEDLRPRRLDEIVGQPSVVDRIRQLVAGVRAGRIVPPHLLLHGPPGVGKTTLARAFAREVLGQDWENGFNTIAATDERGIDFIRARIVPLLELPPMRGAPFRIFFFDEADSLDPEAQRALRPAMEGEARRCVFILACNDLDAIAEAVQSRCVLLEFAPIGPEAMRQVLIDAAAKLPYFVGAAALDSLVVRARGIPREAIKLLIEEFAAGSGVPYPA